MHRIGVYAATAADLAALRNVLGGASDADGWHVEYYRAWQRFVAALERRELRLGVIACRAEAPAAQDVQALAADYPLVLLGAALPEVTATTVRLPAEPGPELAATVRQALHRAELDDELAYLEHHDPSTGLLRASSFAQRLNELLTHSAGEPPSPARLARSGLLCLRLDGFGELESTLGSASAERVLRMAAERLRGVLGRGESLARGDGAEFLAWVRLASNPANAAARLQQVFESPFHLAESSAFVRASVGIAKATGANSRHAGEGPGEALVRQARAAAEAVQQRSGARTLVYDPAIEGSTHRQHVRRALAGALEREEFDVYYQPIIDLARGQVAGAEALLRWHGQSVGEISPAHFIPLAEESGAISSIGQWVLRRACQDAVLWLDRFWTQVRVAINVAPDQIRSGHLQDDLQAVLRDLPLHPRQLELEISERHYLSLAREHYGLVEVLRDLGVRIVVDEFGSSYASPAYLKRYPVDVLKIDRTFVAAIGTATDDARLLAALVGIGKSSGTRVVAVGVETEAQLDCVRGLGCDEAQGFYLGAPMPADDFIATVLRNPPVTGGHIGDAARG